MKKISILAMAMMLAAAATAALPTQSPLMGVQKHGEKRLEEAKEAAANQPGALPPGARPADPPVAKPSADEKPVKPSDKARGTTSNGYVASKTDKNFNWVGATCEMLLDAYCDRVGKTPLIDPNCPKNVQVTLKSPENQQLTNEEYLEAIEAVLEMNGIHLENYGDRFVRALPRKDARKEGIPIIMEPDERKLTDNLNVVSMMIPFKNMSVEDAQKVLENFKSTTSGPLIAFERTNNILVTDTAKNVQRMLEIAQAIDVATPATEQSFVRQVKNASAADIKAVLDQIVQDSQKIQEQQKQPAKTMVGPQFQPMGQREPLGSGGQKKADAAKTAESLLMSISDADRGIIRGRVTIVAEERSNKLVIITSKSNMDFFDKVIEELDVETTPDTVVKLYRLKYADAEDVSDMLNDLIGNASSSKSGSKNTNQNAKKGTGKNLSNNKAQTARPSANQRSGETKAGELSKDNTTILADKRINSIVYMTNKDLESTVTNILASMDVKLSQVLIETMILQIQLSDTIETGIDWVTGLAEKTSGDVIQGLGGGGGDPKASVGSLNFSTPSADKLISPGAAGASYYLASKALNIGAIMKAAKSDSRAKLVASPIIMTLDNKEATIEATKMRYLLKGYTYSGSTYNGSAVPDYEQKEIGLTAKITPKINPNGTVMLEVEEEFSAIGDSQTIQAATGGTSNNQQVVSGISVETTVTRKLSADITVENHQTVILGGLSQTEYSVEETGIPILKDIPWIGRYLFGSTKDVETRQELLMFLTPYVLDDKDSAVREATRRKRTMSDPKPWDDHGWSKSPLADPVSLKEQLRRKTREWEALDAEYEAQLKIEEKNKERVVELKERAAKATKKRAEEAKKMAQEINAAEEKKAEARAEAEAENHAENAPLLNELRSESGEGESTKPAAESEAQPEKAASVLSNIDAMAEEK